MTGVFGLLGGLALFLLGMDFMTNGLKAVAGDRLRGWLARLTRNRFLGVTTGALTTAIINSSSVTTVILVGFISAGLMSLAQAVPVIMGANIGSTATAQLLAFDITKVALPMVTAGFAAYFVSPRPAIRHYGGMVLGLGLVFHGMALMSEAMRPLRSHPPFLEAMVAFDHRGLAILIGAAFTALVQSSAATTGLVLVFTGQGLLSLEGAIAITLGANVGTCATAGLASIGKPREAVRAAAAHVVFNVAGVVIWVAFVSELASLSRWISPASAAGLVAADVPRQVANAHTLFNVGNTLILVWFAPQIARLVERLIPDRPLDAAGVPPPTFIDPAFLFSPAFAVERAQQEVGRIGEQVGAMLRAVMPAILGRDPAALGRVADADDEVDRGYAGVVDYLSQISALELTPTQSDAVARLTAASNTLEHIGDLIETNMVHTGNRMVAEGVEVDATTAAVLRGYHARVVEALDAAVVAVRDADRGAAKQVRQLKESLHRLSADAARHQIARLGGQPGHGVVALKREMELLEHLATIYHLARRMVRKRPAPEAEPENGAPVAGAVASAVGAAAGPGLPSEPVHPEESEVSSPTDDEDDYDDGTGA